MTTQEYPDVNHSTELSFDTEHEQLNTQQAAVLPRRTAGSSGCPSPHRPLTLVHDPAILQAVLNGLHRLGDGAVAW